jgi:peptide/nickel transport system substrate-binding protein
LNQFRLAKILYLLTLLTLTACRSATPTPTLVIPSESSATPNLDTPISPTPPATSTSSAALPTVSPSPSPSPSLPPQGGTAILGLVGWPDRLNPITESNLALRELSPLLFDTLLRVDPQTAHLQPGLAQSWAYSEDGQQVIFHLPPGLKWSNGDPLTAAAVAGSLAATQHPALLAFSDISAPDDETLVLTFINIDCAAVTSLAQLPLLPAPEITATVPTGSGPFLVTDWSESKRTLDLAQNPNYRGPRPILDGLTLRFLQEDEIPIALSEGQFDAIGPIQLPIVNSELLITNSELTIHNSQFTNFVYPAPQLIYVAINFDPANDDSLASEIRQALLLALDREAILEQTLAGDGQLVAGSLLPSHWAANDTLAPPDYDPVTARSLLVEAGLGDEDGDGWLDQNGQRLELSIRLNGKNMLHQDLGWLLSSYYRDLGLFVRAESVPFASVVDDLFTHDFTLAIFSWPLLPDPDQRRYWHSTENTEGLGLNFTSYRNPQLDTLLDQAIAVPGCQPEARAEIYADIQAILAQERPVDFLLIPNRHVLVANRLQGLQPGAFSAFTWNVAEWYLTEE